MNVETLLRLNLKYPEGNEMKKNSGKLVKNDEEVSLKEINGKEKLYEIIALCILSAITLVMGFTPLGYIHGGLIIITFMSVPVTVAATLLRPRDAAVIGTIFGITSFVQAILGTSTLTGALFRLNPALTLFLCVVPRIFVGLFGGLIFKYINEVDKTDFISYIVASLVVPMMNTLLFTTTLYVMVNIIVYINPEGAGSSLPPDFSSAFLGTVSDASNNIISFFVDTMGAQAILEAIICCVFGTTISKVLSVILKKAGILQKNI